LKWNRRQRLNCFRRDFVTLLLRKAVTLLVVMVLFGWFYMWASAPGISTKPDRCFGLGVLHGALMPLRCQPRYRNGCPHLRNGQFGASLQIGYICGIDVCGLSFSGHCSGVQNAGAAWS